MSNRHDQEELSAYQDGELSLTESRKLEIHLQDCPSCRTILDRFERTSRALHEWKIDALTLEAPADMESTQAVWSPLRALAHRRLWPATAAAIVVIGIGVGVNFFRESELTKRSEKVEARSSADVAVQVLGKHSHLIILKGQLSGLEPRGHWRDQ